MRNDERADDEMLIAALGRALLLVAVGSTSVPRPAPEPTTIPGSVIELFRYLRSVAPTGSGDAFFTLRKPIDPDTILKHTAKEGIFFSDVSAGAPGQVDTDQVRKALRRGRGEAFRYIVHLSYVLANTERLGGVPRVLWRDENRMVVDVYDIYQLTFVKEGVDWKVARVELIDPGGD